MIRVCTLSVPLFRAGGLELNTSWQEVDAKEGKCRKALTDHVGRFIQVHPADHSKLGPLGLAFDEKTGKLVEKKNANAGAKPGKDN